MTERRVTTCERFRAGLIDFYRKRGLDGSDARRQADAEVRRMIVRVGDKIGSTAMWRAGGPTKNALVNARIRVPQRSSPLEIWMGRDNFPVHDIERVRGVLGCIAEWRPLPKRDWIVL
jgi:hypothetical protein